MEHLEAADHKKTAVQKQDNKWKHGAESHHR